MAEGKKSFVFYCDWSDIFDELSDEQVGKLMRHILDYVNDKNPKTEDPFIKLSFVQIKNTLKRDLEKYREKADRSRENGKKGGRPKKNPDKPKKTHRVKKKPKKPDSDSVSVNDNVNDSVNVIETPFCDLDFFKKWEEWKKYKHEQFKFKYKKTGEKAALTSLYNEVDGDEQKAIDWIIYSMGKGWKGIYRPKEVKENKGMDRLQDAYNAIDKIITDE